MGHAVDIVQLHRPIHLALGDAQHLRDDLASVALPVARAFIAVEQDQHIDHLLGRVRALARNPGKFLPLARLQRHGIEFHSLTRQVNTTSGRQLQHE